MNKLQTDGTLEEFKGEMRRMTLMYVVVTCEEKSTVHFVLFVLFMRCANGEWEQETTRQKLCTRLIGGTSAQAHAQAQAETPNIEP